MANLCPACSATVPDGVVACTQCGTAVPYRSPAAPGATSVHPRIAPPPPATTWGSPPVTEAASVPARPPESPPIPAATSEVSAAEPRPTASQPALAQAATTPSPTGSGRGRKLLVVLVPVLVVAAGAIGFVAGGSDDDGTESFSSIDTTVSTTAGEPSTLPAPRATAPVTEATPPTPNSVALAPVSELSPVSAVASDERVPADQRCTGETVFYSAPQLIDGDLQTGWGAGQNDGTGQSIRLTFSGPVQLTRIGLTPGYAKIGPRADRGCVDTPAFGVNRFVPLVEYRFDDGSTVTQRFDRRPDIQTIEVDVVTSSVVITVLETILPPGADDDTVLSEAYFEGRPA